jgi:hypothetical protein
MFNRYEQVLLIYLRQWQAWAYVGGWIAMFPLLDVLPSWWQRMMAFIFLSLAATGPAAVIGEAKQQIADARASLTPGFRGPHVVVAVALSLAAIVLMPLLTHRALDVPLLGLTASVAICACALANLAYFQSITSVAVSMAATALLLPPTIREIGFAMLMGERNGSAVAVLAVASAILTWIFYRLAVLREGMGEYGRILGDRSDYAWSDARTVPRREALPASTSLLARFQLAATDRRLRAIRNVFAAHTRLRVRHWMLYGELSGPKWVAAGFVAALLTVMPWFVEGFDAAPDRQAVVAIGALISVLIPIFCVTATWMSRRRTMGYELTRPVPREQFVREFGLAVAQDLTEWWLWLTAAALVPVLVWGPALRVPDLLAMIVLSAGEQVLAFGILVSLLRVRSPRASDGSIMMSVVVVLAPIMVTASIPRTLATTLAIALGVAALGAALTYDAYRRWCEADLA